MIAISSSRNTILLMLLVTARMGAAARASTWTKVEGGGDTICGKGTKFEFLVKRGTVDKLMIEFMGGGACFSALTCSLPEWLPIESADAMLALLATKPGLHNPKQVTSDWHAIYVPYCTGDGHVGNNTKHYVDQTVHHMGGVNARAVLDYAFENFPNVTSTLTVGQSAGAVATYMWAPYIMDHYKNADHTMIADSYVPLFGKTGVTDGLANWNMASSFPRSIVKANYTKWMSYFPGWASSFAIKVFHRFPNARFGVYASNADRVESAFYDVEGCGLEGCSWKKAMRDVMGWIGGNCSNVWTYIGHGSSHTQTVDNSEYSMVSDGVRLSDWINALVNGTSPPTNKAIDCAPKCGVF